MNHYKVRVLVYENGDDSGEVADSADYEVSIDNTPNKIITFNDLLNQIATSEINWVALNALVKSHRDILSVLSDVQVAMAQVGELFQTGRYSDLLELQAKVTLLNTVTLSATVQEARMIHSADILVGKES